MERDEIEALFAGLFADLELAHGDGRFPRLFRTLTKADLLILDDWGPDRLNSNQRRDLMEIVEDRYGAGSTLITKAARYPAPPAFNPTDFLHRLRAAESLNSFP